MSVTPKQLAFFAAYKECGNISKALKAAGLSQGNHQRCKWNAEYAALFAEAKEEAVQKLEEEARRRAHDGTPEPVFYKGVQCGAVQRYSDNLLMFLLEAARPEVYAKRNKLEVVKESTVSDEDLERIAFGGTDNRDDPSASSGGTTPPAPGEE